MNAAVNFEAPFQFDDMVSCVCNKFARLTPPDVRLFFKLPGYNNFTLQNDVDAENMISLARSLRLQCIDVIIQLRDVLDADRIGIPVHNAQTVPCHTEGTNDESDIEDDEDLLGNFCPHVEKVFLSTPWANGVRHVGQSFEGGAGEFRMVLRKFVVECGF
ncbi:hypothetical protein ACSBR1_035065 [Camellia fascicularis]